MTHLGLEKLYESHIQLLSLTDRLQLVELIVKRVMPLAEKPLPRRLWRELRGGAAYPLLNEDAQQWVSRTRQEDRHEPQ
jgi:hypothetical protein